MSHTNPLPELPEPDAHMYPSDLEKFKTRETWAQAFSVAVGNPDERSEPLFAEAKMNAHAAAAYDLGARSAAAQWLSPADQLPPDETVVLALRKGRVTLAELRWEHPGHEDSFQSFRFWAEPHDQWIGEESLEKEISLWCHILEVPK